MAEKIVKECESMLTELRAHMSKGADMNLKRCEELITNLKVEHQVSRLARDHTVAFYPTFDLSAQSQRVHD